MFLLACALGHIGLTILAIRPGVSSSRRLLAGTLAFLIPGAGVLLAALVRSARGGHVALAPLDASADAPLPNVDDVWRVCDMPSLLERLMSSDGAERLAALIVLSNRADAGAIKMLRWAVEHGPPEVVLDAALTLEELDLRREKNLELATERLLAEPGFATALAAGDAAAQAVMSGLADPVTVPALAEQARSSYLFALDADPARWAEVEERMARLELHAGRPAEALELVVRLGERLPVGQAFALHDLRDAAAFAARRFELVDESSAGLAPDLSEHPALVRLDRLLARHRTVERRKRPRHQSRAASEAAAAVKVATGVWRLETS